MPGTPLAGDLAGLPPVRLHVGENEVLLDDARRYDEGDSGEVHVWEGMTHVFPASLGTLATTTTALDDIGDFLRQQLHSRTSGTAQATKKGTAASSSERAARSI